MRAATLVMLLAMSGCELEEAPQDLAVPDLAPAIDAITPDASLSPDLASAPFCERLEAARSGAPPSDCAVAYFLGLEQCVAQASGACNFNNGDAGIPPPSLGHMCWENGTSASFVSFGGVHQWAYARDGKIICSANLNSFCLATPDHACESDQTGSRANGTLSPNGFTCPDGTTIGDVTPCIQLLTATAPSLDPRAHCDGVGTATCDFP